MTPPAIPYLGESLALLTAVIWATAVILFKKSGDSVHPIGLNLFKNLLAVMLFVPTILLFGEKLLYPAPLNDYLLLLGSGALGIGLADTLYFQCLNRVGAGMTAIIACLYSPFVIGLSVIWLDESLSLVQLLGVGLIIAGVIVASPRNGKHPSDRRTLLTGVMFGVLSVAGTAIGIVMAKPVLDHSPLLWVTMTRLMGGVIVLCLFLLFHPRRKAILSSLLVRSGRIYTVSSSFVGAYLAMFVWLAGMKYTQASTASALNQTSNIFIFLLAALFLNERVTAAKLSGILLGVGGAILVTLG